MESFEEALKDWQKRVNDMLLEHRKTFCSTLAPEVIHVLEGGPKYHKVNRSDGSVFCFIDKQNGDVLKAATWRGPAPHARGNIFTRRESLGVGPFGANYIKRGLK
jgi:hypothetical protein